MDGAKPAIQEIKLILKPFKDSAVKQEPPAAGDDSSAPPHRDDDVRAELEEGEIRREDISKEDMEALRRRGQLRYSQDERVNTVLKHLYGNEAVSPVRSHYVTA